MEETPPTNENEEELDVGNNLKDLGFTFLFLKYILPILLVIVGLGLFIVVGWFVFAYLSAHVFDFSPWGIVIACIVLILLLIIAA